MSHSFVQSQRQLLSFNYNKNQSFHANQVELIELLKINGFADTLDELVNAIKARWKILIPWISMYNKQKVAVTKFTIAIVWKDSWLLRFLIES